MRVIILKDVLAGILLSAKKQYPREFFCLLGGKKEGNVVVIREIVFIPFKNSERSVVFDMNSLPMDERIVGSAHSHPLPSSPSRADLRTFPATGWIHIIVFPPFDLSSFRVYDAKGQKIRVEIV